MKINIVYDFRFVETYKGRVIFKEKELKYDKSTLVELRKIAGLVFQDPDKQIFFQAVLMMWHLLLKP